MAKIGAKLKAAQEAGTLTERQQARVDYLNSKKGGGKGKKKGGNGRFSKSDRQTRQALNADRQVQQANSQMLNPTYHNPYGDQIVTYDENGNPVVNQTLSEPNQNILNQGQNLTQVGQQMAQGLMNNYQAFNGGQFDRQRVEDAAYNRTTRYMNQDYDREKEALAQQLYNSGNPPGSPRYQQEMEQLQRRFDSNKENAALNAVSVGSQEQNQAFNQGLVGHQQNLADMGFLQQQGSGFISPNWAGYQAPNQLASSTDVNLAFQGMDLQKAQFEWQRQMQQQQLGLQAQALAQQAQGAPAAPAGPQTSTGGSPAN